MSDPAGGEPSGSELEFEFGPEEHALFEQADGTPLEALGAAAYAAACTYVAAAGTSEVMLYENNDFAALVRFLPRCCARLPPAAQAAPGSAHPRTNAITRERCAAATGEAYGAMLRSFEAREPPATRLTTAHSAFLSLVKGARDLRDAALPQMAHSAFTRAIEQLAAGACSPRTVRGRAAGITDCASAINRMGEALEN